MLNWLRTRLAPDAAPVLSAALSPAPLRVVIEVGGFDKGGLERVVLDSALAFDRERIVAVIVSNGPLGEAAVAARRAGLDVVGLPRRGAEQAYARVLDAVRPSLAVAHFSTAGYALFARRGIPVLSFIHNVYAFLDAPQRRRFAEDDRLVAHYVSVSPNATRYATERFGIAAARITTIPNGLDTAAYARRDATTPPLPRARFGIGADDYVFLNVAAYNLHKGHHLMAAAMRSLLRHRRDIRIVCVGNVVVPEHVQILRARLTAEGLSRHMLLAGWHADVAELFAMADAFLLPSFIEGWSIAMNEAMAFGKPMILTDTGAAAEVIEAEDIGIIVPNEYGAATALDSASLDRLAYDGRDFRVAADLAAAMARFADHRAYWAEAGALGRRKLRARYDLADVVARYEAVMRTTAGMVAPP